MEINHPTHVPNLLQQLAALWVLITTSAGGHLYTSEGNLGSTVLLHLPAPCHSLVTAAMHQDEVKHQARTWMLSRYWEGREARQAGGQEEAAAVLLEQAVLPGAGGVLCVPRVLLATPAAWPGPWSMLFGVPCPLCRRCALGAVEFPDRLKTSHLKHNRLFLWMLLLFCSALQKQL